MNELELLAQLQTLIESPYIPSQLREDIEVALFDYLAANHVAPVDEVTAQPVGAYVRAVLAVA